jgi:pimeloyl-ACP methyl ester carboxylesterase
LESVWKLPPGGSFSQPQEWQAMFDENARTTPLAYAAPPPPDVGCEMVKNFSKPTLIMRGEKTYLGYVVIAAAISKCVSAARLVVLPNVNHDGPVGDPKGFTSTIVEFLSKH